MGQQDIGHPRGQERDRGRWGVGLTCKDWGDEGRGSPSPILWRTCGLCWSRGVTWKGRCLCCHLLIQGTAGTGFIQLQISGPSCPAGVQVSSPCGLRPRSTVGCLLARLDPGQGSRVGRGDEDGTGCFPDAFPLPRQPLTPADPRSF